MLEKQQWKIKRRHKERKERRLRSRSL